MRLIVKSTIRLALPSNSALGGSAKLHTSSVTASDSSLTELPEARRSGVQAWQKKGAGGRNSFSGNVATIFGAGGRYGRYIASRLGKDGTQMIFPYRSDPQWIRHLKLSGDLGQTLFFPFELDDEESIRKCIKYSNVVINMIGVYSETNKWNFWDVHEKGARTLARLSKEMGVEKFIQISAMNASHNPTEYLIPGGSEFLRSKAAGEDAVREEFPEAIIVRPGMMYGFHDRFFEYMCHWSRTYAMEQLDLWRKGEETFKMPLFAPDMALGIKKCVDDPTLAGKTLEFVGPFCYQMGEMADYIFRRIGQGREDQYYHRHNAYGPIITSRINFMESFFKMMKWDPKYNWEIIETHECVSDVLTGVPTLEDIGVKNLRIFEIASGSILDSHFSKAAYIEGNYDDFIEPPIPLRRRPLFKNIDKIRPETLTRAYDLNREIQIVGSA